MNDPASTAVAKVTSRLLPFLFLGAIFAQLDRSNVSMAALQMNDEIGISPAVFGLGVGAFFVAYALFEVPSNVALARFGARRWLARIMISWGLISALSAFVVGPKTFLLNRILLGVAEAGFLPGVLAYLSTWLPERERARVFSYFLVAIPVAVVLGGPLAAALLAVDALGLSGWQWLFLVEGLAPVVLGVIYLKVLRDGPRVAEWLTSEEAEALSRATEIGGPRPHARPRFADMVRAIATRRVLVFLLILASLGGVNLGVTFWLPQVMKAAGLATTQIGFLSTLPYAFGAAAMLLWARSSDRRQERRWHLVLPAMLAASALGLLPLAGGLSGQVVLIVLAMMGIFSAQAVFWSSVSAMLEPHERFVGLAAISAGGALLSFPVPSLIGLSKQVTGNFAGAFVLLAALGVAGGLLSLIALKPSRKSP